MNKFDEAPRTFFLIPWSSGFECRVQKPAGHSIEVINREDYDKLVTEMHNAMRYYKSFGADQEDKSDPEFQLYQSFKKLVGEPT